MNILLAEDDNNDAALVERALKRASRGVAHVFRAKDGCEVIQYLNGEPPYADRSKYPLPAIVILDLNMPKMDGFQVLQWVRNHPQLKSLPVIILSASNSELDVARAYSLFANSYLTKRPLLQTPEILEGVLKYWVEQNQPPRMGE